MISSYCELKRHFDRLLFGGYPKNNGLEYIRDVYERCFNRPINLFDVYSTKLNVPYNRITEVITLVGPTEEIESEDGLELPYGLIPTSKGLVYVNIFDDDIFKGLSGDDAINYTEAVYNSIMEIVKLDVYSIPRIAACNPYYSFMKGIPVYQAFNHIRDCVPSALDSNVFKDIIEKYCITGEGTDKLYNSLMENKYSEKIEDIVSILSCKNTITFD